MVPVTGLPVGAELTSHLGQGAYLTEAHDFEASIGKPALQLFVIISSEGMHRVIDRKRLRVRANEEMIIVTQEPIHLLQGGAISVRKRKLWEDIERDDEAH